MGKSLFFRMLFVYLLAIIFAFALVGGMFFESLKSDYLYSQMDIMISNAQEINDWATENYYGRMTNEEFNAKLDQKATEEGTVIWLVSSLGVYKISDPESKGEIEERFSSESTIKFFNETQKGNRVRQISNVDRSFREAVISVAVPLTVDDTIVGAIVVHRSVDDF